MGDRCVPHLTCRSAVRARCAHAAPAGRATVYCAAMTVRRGVGLLVVSLITFALGAIVFQFEDPYDPNPVVQVIVLVLGGLTPLCFFAGLVTIAWALLRPSRSEVL